MWTVKNKVETSFDENEFLEGAKDAYVAGASADTCALCNLKQSVDTFANMRGAPLVLCIFCNVELQVCDQFAFLYPKSCVACIHCTVA